MKGILFTEILFNKTIRKGKTMTRRAPASLKIINDLPDNWKPNQVFGDKIRYEPGYTDKYSVYSCFDAINFISRNGCVSRSIKPTYKVGEVVYIKEPTLSGVLNEDGDTFLVYKYDFTEEERKDYKWGNKMFMGADKARYYIRITSVKVERLYDISDENCLKEGIDVDKAPYREDFFYDYQNNDYSFITPKGSFFSLFRFANRVPKSKEIPNMWVFCYEYCLCDINGNEL